MGVQTGFLAQSAMRDTRAMSIPAATGFLALVVDDERPLAGMVSTYLERAGLRTMVEHSGPEAVDRARSEHPDVVILDLGLPGMDGIEVCTTLRTFTDCYILILTARGDEVDRLLGLAAGADDYIVKPFSVREVVARVQAVLRRPRANSPAEATLSPTQTLTLEQLTIDTAGRQVFVAGEEVRLTRTEFDILCALLRRPGAVLSRRQILDEVWDHGWIGDEHLVDVHVANLRQKLGDSAANPQYIVTVRGLGFRTGKG